MKDLEQKHQSLTLALAAKSADAYEAWVAMTKPDDSAAPIARRELRAVYDRLETEIGDLVKERELVARALNFELEATVSDRMHEAAEKLREMQEQMEAAMGQPLGFDHSAAEANGGTYPPPTPEQEEAIKQAFPEAGMEVGTPVSGNGAATDVVVVRGRRVRTPKH